MDEIFAHEDDRPYARHEGNRSRWVAIAGTAALLAALGGSVYYYYDYFAGRFDPPQRAAAPDAPAASAPADASAADAPAIRHPLPGAEPGASASLPALDQSDAVVRESLVGLMGSQAFADMVVPQQLIRRIVATVDNLPRATAPRRVWPLDPVPGAFVTAVAQDEAVIHPANAARYAPYVRVLESLDTGALVQSYVRLYPLFQRAYEELGFPDKYFNDRVVQALDDLLATPELDAPIALVRPKILYEFADPELETRSAGQKLLLRIGPENAARVKKKLIAIRQAVVAASERR
jgi:hypothetical protein